MPVPPARRRPLASQPGPATRPRPRRRGTSHPVAARGGWHQDPSCPKASGPEGRDQSLSRRLAARTLCGPPAGIGGIDRLPRRWLELDGLARRSGRLQHRTLRHHAVRQVAPERDHVLDNVAQTAPDLVLILSREGLRPARRGAETTPAEPSSPPRSRRSAGQGGDDGPAACDEPAAQPGGGLRAAARWSGRSRGRVRASPAAPLASGPGAPEDAAEGGGV